VSYKHGRVKGYNKPCGIRLKLKHGYAPMLLIQRDRDTKRKKEKIQRENTKREYKERYKEIVT
jgi:hypothetical protein